jgi:insertion element IS1 protein InsB
LENLTVTYGEDFPGSTFLPKHQTTSQTLERKHLALRTRIKRLTRETLGFSRSCAMHDLLIGLYMNQVEFGCPV